ncbi:MAG: hypothetical protein ACE1Y2_06990, partial [Stenotrophomonas maltophilia]
SSNLRGILTLPVTVPVFYPHGMSVLEADAHLLKDYQRDVANGFAKAMREAWLEPMPAKEGMAQPKAGESGMNLSHLSLLPPMI